mgnify:CR=1 FL=1
MIDDGVAKEEVGDRRRDLRPAVVLHDESGHARRAGVVGRPLLRKAEVDVRDSSRPDLEALAEELALRIHFAEVIPGRSLRDTRADGLRCGESAIEAVTESRGNEQGGARLARRCSGTSW